MWGQREHIGNLSRILWGGCFNQSVFCPLGVELYRKILGRSAQDGCHWFAFFREGCREKGIGVAMGGFVHRKNFVVPVHRMMWCPMVEENTCLKVVGAEFHGDYSVLLVGCWCWVGA